MFKQIISFSKNNYRLKFGIALAFLLLLMATTAVYIYTNSKVEADVQEPKTAIAYLPQIDFSQIDFFIKIEKIGVFAPIIPEVDGSDKTEYFASLQRGVAHMSGTAKPGEKGNVVIFGHSNYYENDPGAYKQIFRNLDELKTGDKIVIHYQDKNYNYLVLKQQKVEPTDTWVISAPYNLTLITCWPPGTVEKRLIIFANNSGD